MTPDAFKLSNRLLHSDSSDSFTKLQKDSVKWNKYVDPKGTDDIDNYYLSFEEAMLVDFEKAIKKDLKLLLKNNRL